MFPDKVFKLSLLSLIKVLVDLFIHLYLFLVFALVTLRCTFSIRCVKSVKHTCKALNMLKSLNTRGRRYNSAETNETLNVHYSYSYMEDQSHEERVKWPRQTC